MLTFKKLTAPSNKSVQGIVNYLKETAEYYEQGMNLPAYWQGRGIEESGLNDAKRDANQDFAKLLAGVDPVTNKRLKELKENSVIAIDLTTSVPKGFSIALASCKDEIMRQRMAEAMREANDFTCGHVIDSLRCRTGAQGRGKAVAPERSYIRSVMHLDSRDGDSQAHFHNALVNMGVDEKGKARCLDMDRIVRMQPVASALFDARLASNFRKLGLGVEREIERNEYGEETGAVRYSISGIGRDTEMEFSGRREDIERAKEEARKQGKTLTGSEANKLTRKGKDNELTPQEIIARTQSKVAELHKQNRLDWSDSQQLVGREGHVETLTLAEIVSGMHENESYFSRDQLIEQVAKKGALDIDPITATDTFLEGSKSVIALKEKGLYCTVEQWQMERACVLSAITRQGDGRHNLDPDAVERAIQAQEKELGFPLAHDQAEAVRHACGRSGGFAIIEGNAGTGKTASAGAYVKAHQEAGYTVWGASTSQVATDNLADEVNGQATTERKPTLVDALNSSTPNDRKMEAFNTAKLLLELDSGRLKLTDKHLLVLDEAGMVGAKTMHRLQQHSDRAGAKIIAVGDSKQLQPIQAGNPFYAMGDVVGKSEITEIRRQKNKTHLEMANAFYDQHKDGHALVKQMKEKGMIVQGTNKQDAIGKLVSDYLNDPKTEREKLILASTHADSEALTDRLRKQLDQAGRLGERQDVMTARSDGKIMKVEEKDVAVNDRIRFTRNQQHLGLRNNDLGTVVGFEREKNTRFINVRMDKDPDTVKKIPLTDKANHFVHGYVRTVHSSQGLGEAHVYALANQARTTNRNMVMVSFTRTKEQFRYYGTEREFSGMADRLANFENKKSVQDMLPGHMRLETEQMYKQAHARQRLQVAEQFPSAKAEWTLSTEQKLRAYKDVVKHQDQRMSEREQAVEDRKGLKTFKQQCERDLAKLDAKKKELGLFGPRTEKKSIEAKRAEKLQERQGAELAYADVSKKEKQLDKEIELNTPKVEEARNAIRELEERKSFIESKAFLHKWMDRYYKGGEKQQQKDHRTLSHPPAKRLSNAIERRQENELRRKAEREEIRQALENAQLPSHWRQQEGSATSQDAPKSEHKRQRSQHRGLSL